MNFTKESLKAHNKQRENNGNDAYRKTHKLGTRIERLGLDSLSQRVHGILGGHHKLTVKEVIEHGHIIVI